MSETQQPVEMTTPESETPDGTNNQTLDSVLQELNATREALKKANAEAASRRKKLDELAEEEQRRKESEMTELEKMKAQLERSNKELEALRLNALKQQIASEVGLPDALALRLAGDDEEAIRADAAALLKTLPKAAPTPPKINATNPGGNGEQPEETDAQKRARIYGLRGADIFNPAVAAKQGGGVFIPDTGEK